MPIDNVGSTGTPARAPTSRAIASAIRRRCRAGLPRRAVPWRPWQDRGRACGERPRERFGGHEVVTHGATLPADAVAGKPPLKAGRGRGMSSPMDIVDDGYIVRPDPADPRLTRAVTGVDHTGAPIETR